MHNTAQRLNLIKDKIKEVIDKKQLKTQPQIIAISKTFALSKILPLIDVGHIHFGENKIQEAEDKWSEAKLKYKNLQLHMVGKLQSNKAKKAVKLFEYIHSLDNEKLARKIDQCQNELNKKSKLFIQVNIEEESQKSGILLNDLAEFYNFCTKELSLNIIGLMTLPKIDADPTDSFKMLREKSLELNLNELSMGMSNDYEKAIINGSTFLRLGTAIFGDRST
tara:strand:- start:1711 stop:2376 length:666 start_codon:yes stop_codon:yes gene_type:complete